MKKKIIILSISIVLLILCFSFIVCNGYIWFNNPDVDKFPIRGVDISAHQKNIDWQAVKENDFEFIFIKATEGKDFKDKLFKENWKNSKSIGLKRGAYHFFTFRSSGKEQAANFIDSVPNEANCLPPVIDIEFGGNSKVIPTRDEFNNELKDFIKIIEDHYKKKPIFYVTYKAYNKYIYGDYSDYKIWIRDVIKYPNIKDNRDWIIWQYNSRGRVKGFFTFVDLNVFNGDMQAFEEQLLDIKK